ncbi:MAG: hypothetical protein EAX89_05060 [Candidatus Lokiarchaeota archaeon]|nr:hypothetical protein [Candidatus Lokiarchaeota archaeon]
MTIEIDDAGTGDLVGDAFIGFLRKETDQLLFKKIPLELFKKESWENKAPLKRVVEIVKEALEELNFDHKKEKILLCRGNIFDELRSYFNEEGVNYEPAIIEGKLQDAVENRYLDHLRNDLGIRSKRLTTKSGAKRYFLLFNWVSYDFYNREKYVKSGFKRWNTIWRQRAIEKYEKIVNNGRSTIK